MADSPRPPVPASLDRSAVERILARASELQTSAVTDPDGRLSEEQLEALAKEVGLDPINLRQAIAEERTRSAVPQERGMLAKLYGGAFATAQRTVSGRPADVLKALDDWMQRQEGLVVQRYFGDRIVWESRRDLIGAVRRVASGRGHVLLRASCVSATVIPVDGSRSLVRLDADLGSHRSLMANQTAAIGGVGVLTTGTLVMLSFAAAAAVVPALVLAPVGYAASRAAHKGAVSRAQLVLEQVLDRLERGEAGRPPSLISMLAAAVGARKL
jgi:hypothetical protein